VIEFEGGKVRTTVAAHSDGETLREVVSTSTRPKAMINSDERGGYIGLPASWLVHPTVGHAAAEWAGDDDGARGA